MGSRSILALALLALASCGGTRTQDVHQAPPTVDVPPPWTDVFLEGCTLIADTIVVEGPAGLRDHCAGRQDQTSIDYDLATTSRGLEQTFVLVPGSEAVEIRGWIDRWELFAFEKLVIVERPTRGGEIVVRAVGNVLFADADGDESRSPTFERRVRTGS